METSESPSAPWQFQWKRPRLAIPVSPDTLRQNERRLHGSVPIECKSARLTTAEARCIFKYLSKIKQRDVVDEKVDKSIGYENHDMEWEDLSDDDHGMQKDKVCNIQNQNAENEDYVLSVTILASEASVKVLRDLQQNNLAAKGRVDELLPADTIYMQVIKDSSRIIDSKYDEFSCDDKDDYDEVKVVMSKLMLWPASALIDIEATKEIFSFSEALSNALQSVSKALKIIKAQPINSEETNDDFTTKKLEQQAKHIRQRIGVKSFALSRRTLLENKQNNFDLDGLYEVLDRMAFHSASKKDHSFEMNKIFSNANNMSSNIQGNVPFQNELVLSFLANDGHVHIFKALDVLLMQDNLTSQSTEMNLFRVVKERDTREVLFNEFESLVFGDELQSTLKETLLPLSNPKATIPLSVVSGIETNAMSSRMVPISPSNKISQNDTDNAEFECENIHKSLVHDDRLARPLLDLSFLNSNVEPCTIQYRTIRNEPTVCVQAFDHIVVGGRGDKVIKTSKMTDHFSADSRSSDEERFDLQGGFITFISLQNLSESRTVFLPFLPYMLSPTTWNQMQLLFVTGRKKNESLAIRIDASSWIHFDSELGDLEASSPSSISYNKIPSRQNNKKIVNKFSLLDLSFNYDEKFTRTDVNAIEYPLSVSSMAAKMPCMIFYHYDGFNVSLSLHRMVGLKQETHLNNDLGGNKTAIICSHDCIHEVQIPISIEEDELHPNCVSGKVSHIFCNDMVLINTVDQVLTKTSFIIGMDFA